VSLGVFVLGGIILIASGVLQVFLRPRPSDGRPARPIDGAVVRAVIFAIVGVLAVLVGLGVVPLAPL
jgi:hypothetical protein